jgi:carbamoyl-phosphate synthase small subunit
MPEAVATVRDAVASGRPLFGICLGHQLMALSEGMAVEKMKVGHRGANHPVRNATTGRVEITTQNHGFGVVEASLAPDVAEVSHRNLNDGSVEGLRFLRFDGMSVQYHPEARPGPHDSRYLFDAFLARVRAASERPASAPLPLATEAA